MKHTRPVYCPECGETLGECLGCEGFTVDPDLLSLEDTADGRDLTPAPPAYLDVPSILRNRERVRKFLATGAFTWPQEDRKCA